MASTLKDERRDQLVACAEAVAKLAKYRKIEAVKARLVRRDLQIRRVLDTIVRRWTLGQHHHVSSVPARRRRLLAKRRREQFTVRD